MRQNGLQAEERVRIFLQEQGLLCLQKNFYSRFGEIDLVMTEGDTLVFVEVRSRSSSAFGGALGSLSAAKRRKLISTARYYLVQHRISDNRCLRFDLVTLDGTEQNLHWHKNAFGENY